MPQNKECRTLVIEGDLLRIQRTVVEREVKTGDFIAEIARIQPLDTGPLPVGCAWYTRSENEKNRIISIYVLERPAGMQHVRIKTSGDEQTIKELDLSWPNTVWFFRCVGDAIHDLHLACTASPIVALGRDTQLHRLLMPNLYDGGHGAVCLGNLVLKDGMPLAQRIETLLHQTLDSLWNSDLMPSFDGSGVTGLDHWAAQSTNNLQFHTQINFPDHRRQTLGEMLAWLLENTD